MGSFAPFGNTLRAGMDQLRQRQQGGFRPGPSGGFVGPGRGSDGGGQVVKRQSDGRTLEQARGGGWGNVQTFQPTGPVNRDQNQGTARVMRNVPAPMPPPQMSTPDRMPGGFGAPPPPAAPPPQIMNAGGNMGMPPGPPPPNLMTQANQIGGAINAGPPPGPSISGPVQAQRPGADPNQQRRQLGQGQGGGWGRVFGMG